MSPNERQHLVKLLHRLITLLAWAGIVYLVAESLFI